MRNKIPVIAVKQRKIYIIFIIVMVILFFLTSLYTKFNIVTLIKNGDAFWSFIVNDFFPPALPKSGKIAETLKSVGVTLALAISSTTIAAVLAFFAALFGSEKVSPWPKLAKYVRGFATFLRNIPALVWAFILFSSL